jgi:hypothetical protein
MFVLKKGNRILYIVLSILVLSACSKSEGVEVKKYYLGFDRGSIIEVMLDDGTRCITWQNSFKGGITCDWD